MKSIDVFEWIHTFENGVFIDVLWQWQLDENPVDCVVLIEFTDLTEELLRAGGAGDRQLAAVNSELLARLCLHVNVCRRSSVVADEDNSEPRVDATSLQVLNFESRFPFDVVRDFCAIDESSCHRDLAFS